MNINKIRSVLYKAARILGDINAIKEGKAGKRIGRRIAGRQAGKVLNQLFK